MSNVQVLRAALDVLDFFKDASWLIGNPVFPAAIEAALLPPAPGGSPVAIAGSPPGSGGLVQIYDRAGSASDLAYTELSGIAADALPAAWRGRAAEGAVQAVQALSVQAGAAQQAFDAAAGALTVWASNLADAQRRDERGRTLLHQALSDTGGPLSQILDVLDPIWGLVSTPFLLGALAAAVEGCTERLAAAQIMETASADAVTALNQYVDTARAEQIKAPGVDPLSAVVLAYAGELGWNSNPLADILTPTAMTRASQFLDGMSPANRAAFEQLVADANSPQEAAYLWKALGAGHSLTEIQQFDQVIHPHGTDPGWLAEHLSPQINNPNMLPTTKGQMVLEYEGQTTYDAPIKQKPGWVYRYDFYNQLTNGDVNTGDCVAASTVIARASTDPVYMLGMTTGKGPLAVTAKGVSAGDDSSAAFHKRLEQNYSTNYNRNGANAGANANTLLEPATGSTYHSVAVTTPAQRQAALPAIEAAANAGKPVPLDVYPTGDGDGHQVVILAARGNELEVYNPWGFTQWVTKQQFISGQLGDLTSTSPTGGEPEPVNVELPG